MNQVVLVAKEHTGCKGCVFESDKRCRNAALFPCAPYARADGKSVIWAVEWRA